MALQIDELSHTSTIEDIYEALETLPANVDELLNRTLERIRNVEEVKNILQWIAGAREPLSIEQLTEAISLRETDVRWSQSTARRPRNTVDLLRGCGSLIAILPIRNGDVVQFFYPIVLEFLTKRCSIYPQFRLSLSEIERIIGPICVAYTMFPEFKTQISIRPTAMAIKPSALLDQAWTRALGSSWIGTHASYVTNLFQMFRPESNSHFELRKSGRVADIASTARKKFVLLPYIMNHWVYHIRYLDGNQYSTRDPDILVIQKFKGLLFHDELATIFRSSLPWWKNSLEKHMEAVPKAVYEWALANGNSTLALSVQQTSEPLFNVEDLEQYITLACRRGNVKCLRAVLDSHSRGISPLPQLIFQNAVR